MLRRICFVSLLVLVATCNDDGGGSPDARPADAASNATVVAVTCPATPAATIVAMNESDGRYTPNMAAINQGQVIKFTMSIHHDVTPALTMSDPGLVVAKGQEKCLMFTSTGTFRFYCSPHGFAGMVTVN